MSRWFSVLLLAACQGRTELMVGVATDLKAPGSLDGAQLVATRTKDGFVEQQLSWDISGVPAQPFNLPGSFGLFSSGEEIQLDLELQGFKANTPIVSRHAVLSLVAGQTLFLRMTVTAGCVGRTDCSETQSCVEGSCVDRAIDARRLPDFADNLVTELTCASGPTYIDTATGEPMKLSADASMCPADLCSEGTCKKPDPQDTPSTGGDGGLNLGAIHYVIDTQRLPSNNAEVMAFGQDLDGDAAIDNALGRVMATFVGQGIAVQAPLDTAVDRGTSLMLIDLEANNLTNAATARFSTLFGTNPQPPPCNGGGDTMCRKHLDGNASFEISPATPMTAPLQGAIVNGTLTAGPGNLSLQTVLLGAVQIDLLAARVAVTAISPTKLTGVIGGGVSMTEMDNKVIPAMAVALSSQELADCPGAAPSCGCTASSQGKSIHDLLDTAPQDCAVSVAELKNSAVFQALLAPDLTVAGQPAISLGLRFTAVHGTFATP